MEPERALEVARERAAQARAGGAYADDLSGFAIAPTDRISTEQLMEWAVIEPDDRLMRSTRRLGAPITMGKRLLLRSLDQYNNQLLTRQQAFNVELALAVVQLSERVERLEERRG